MKRLCYLICLIGLALSSCITNRDTVLLQRKGDVTKYAVAIDSLYRLQPNDRIIYNIFSTDAETARLFTGISQNSTFSQMQSMDQGYRIYPDGYVRLPFLGELKMVNLTRDEAQALLRKKVRESLPDAEVRLALASSYYYVVGAGKFEIYKDNMTIFQALGSVSGKDKMLDYKHLRLLRRQADGSYLIKTIDLRSAYLLNSEYYYVKPNDIFYFPTNKSDRSHVVL